MRARRAGEPAPVAAHMGSANSLANPSASAAPSDRDIGTKIIGSVRRPCINWFDRDSKYNYTESENERRNYRVRLYSYLLLVLWDIQSTMAESMRATLCETLAVLCQKVSAVRVPCCWVKQHQMRCVFRCSPMLYCAFVLHISFSTSSLRSRWHSPSHCLPAYRRAPIKSFQLLLVVAMRMYAYISNRFECSSHSCRKGSQPATGLDVYWYSLRMQDT